MPHTIATHGIAAGLGVGFFWAAKTWIESKLSDNTVKQKKERTLPMSKENHAEIHAANIKPIIDRLDAGDKSFAELREEIKANHKEIMGYLMALRK